MVSIVEIEELRNFYSGVVPIEAIVVIDKIILIDVVQISVDSKETEHAILDYEIRDKRLSVIYSNEIVVSDLVYEKTKKREEVKSNHIKLLNLSDCYSQDKLDYKRVLHIPKREVLIIENDWENVFNLN